MDTRFAGSQRLGDRRRRRLAVEADETITPSASATELPGGEGRRAAHASHLESPADVVSPLPQLPLHHLVPSAWWKYLLGGLGGLVLIAGVAVADWYAPAWSVATRVDFQRLFGVESSAAGGWLGGLFLGLAAQLALFNWWGRSRSLTDFDGRYRLWTWTAGTWLTLSACASTGAHRLLADLAVALVPDRVPERANLGWLTPACVLAVRLIPALRREMSACRGSRWLMYAAAICYAAAATFEFPLELPWSASVTKLASHTLALAGHLAILLSMWVHARHVLHCTADPSPVPQRRKLRLPRPHFKLPRISLFRRRSATPAVAEEPKPPKRPRRGRKAESESVGVSTTAEAPAAESPGEAAPTKSRWRIDKGHAPKRVAEAEVHEAVEPEVTEPERPAVEPVAEEPPLERTPLRHDPIDEFRDESAMAADGVESTDDESANSFDEEAFEEDGEDEGFDRNQLKGLSKKQRRRMMKEQRDRERSNRGR